MEIHVQDLGTTRQLSVVRQSLILASQPLARLIQCLTCNLGGGRLERILSSLAREWLRITNGLLIVEDPEPAPRSPNKLMRVNGAERRKVVRALLGSKRRTEVLVR
jgi:hypothetical protein